MRSPVDEHLGFFQFMGIMDRTVTNVDNEVRALGCRLLCVYTPEWYIWILGFRYIGSQTPEEKPP